MDLSQTGSDTAKPLGLNLDGSMTELLRPEKAGEAALSMRQTPNGF